MAGVPGDKQPEGKGCASARCENTTHVGSHLDAPWRYHPTMNNGERACTNDEVPLEWRYGRGVKLDFRDKPDGHVCNAADVEAELKRIGHTLAPFDIVLVNMAAGARYGHDDLANRGRGMGREATLYLTERGVRVTGVDRWSWDAPFSYTARRIKERGDYALFWEGRKAGALVATSRSSPILRRCRRPVSSSRASPSRSKSPRPVGAVRWRFSKSVRPFIHYSWEARA